MPLLVWSVFLFPFITTKVLYFRLLVEAALFVYVILAWRYPAYRPRFNLVTKAVWLYVGVVLVAAIFGLDFRTSFMGTVERGEGVVTLLHFAAYFTMLTGVTYREATEQGLTITTKEGQRKTLEADTIVLAAGAVPNQGLYQEIKNKITATYAIGDCVAPRNIHEAISEGYHTALTI